MPALAPRANGPALGYAFTKPHFVPQNEKEMAPNKAKRQKRRGLNNVALTIIGKGEADHSEAFRSAEHVVRHAQSAHLA